LLVARPAYLLPYHAPRFKRKIIFATRRALDIIAEQGRGRERITERITAIQRTRLADLPRPEVKAMLRSIIQRVEVLDGHVTRVVLR
jgi:hypothetical protein